MVAELLLRHGGEALSWEARPADRGTTRAVGRAFGINLVALCFAPVLNRYKVGRLYGTAPAWGGVAVMGSGFALRVWAARALGASYTRTLRTSAQQQLITEGPYRLVRHPGYLGHLLLWLGAAMASANALTAATITVSMGPAYHARIVAEEAMLADSFPEEYPAHAKRTWRLVPFVY